MTDGLEEIRENKEAIEKIAQQDRDDMLDMLARCLLAAADGEELPEDDCREWFTDGD